MNAQRNWSKDSHKLEGKMKTQRNWIKVTVFVVLALASLSSPAVASAASVPQRARRAVYSTRLADLCRVANVDQFDQSQIKRSGDVLRSRPSCDLACAAALLGRFCDVCVVSLRQ